MALVSGIVAEAVRLAAIIGGIIYKRTQNSKVAASDYDKPTKPNSKVAAHSYDRLSKEVLLLPCLVKDFLHTEVLYRITLA
ncbi:MAG: hypothetical protein AB8V19_02725 [Candidatus Midichloria sp.]|uniref:Uncharacterized protein n=1 Tax=Hyalomma marginatum TaxID=34627 RepID=A0A8S4BWD5_9ACAR|nr:hypothetical protein MHYMCMPASI_00659 [Hyalomma marginatum]CAG7593086.1 hypothetical protein MHYMCMPSP_00776 [Hyalomma marginatum]